MFTVSDAQSYKEEKDKKFLDFKISCLQGLVVFQSTPSRVLSLWLGPE
jgi:hypothetical protein